ncbi:hypothetical protein B0H19DRAFT_1089628 [Mycena capillaripes]|nr:hypothetical protein B0H19DRAFT_1089628 [Mycena capillaripes]
MSFLRKLGGISWNLQSNHAPSRQPQAPPESVHQQCLYISNNRTLVPVSLFGELAQPGTRRTRSTAHP